MQVFLRFKVRFLQRESSRDRLILQRLRELPVAADKLLLQADGNEPRHPGPHQQRLYERRRRRARQLSVRVLRRRQCRGRTEGPARLRVLCK